MVQYISQILASASISISVVNFLVSGSLPLSVWAFSFSFSFPFRFLSLASVISVCYRGDHHAPTLFRLQTRALLRIFELSSQ